MKTPARILRIACLLAAGSAAHGAALLTSFESAGDLFPTTATNTPISQSTLYATDGTYSMIWTISSSFPNPERPPCLAWPGWVCWRAGAVDFQSTVP